MEQHPAVDAVNPVKLTTIPRTRSRTKWRRAIATCAVIFIILSVVTVHLFVLPETGMPAGVDAIVVPGGPGDRVDAALKLVKADRARYLVLSEGEPIPQQLCGSHIGNATVLCFQPSPDTTQGEAEGTARLARKYGFQSIALVTTPDQLWRAELRFGRCYSGHIYGMTTPLPRGMWPEMIAYQWAATVKASLINRSC
jgi:uncharacterized SAM-binding protein YcdF (DUF218 family)